MNEPEFPCPEPILMPRICDRMHSGATSQTWHSHNFPGLANCDMHVQMQPLRTQLSPPAALDTPHVAHPLHAFLAPTAWSANRSIQRSGIKTSCVNTAQKRRAADQTSWRRQSLACRSAHADLDAVAAAAINEVRSSSRRKHSAILQITHGGSSSLGSSLWLPA